MYKIGEFSVISKTTIKTLRYYEKEKLLIPAYIDRETGYRYYETKQLVELSKIVSLRQIGLSISDIKKILSGKKFEEFLIKRKQEIEENIEIQHSQLSKINYLLEENNIKNEIVIKELPSYTVFYREGMTKSLGEIIDFIKLSKEELSEYNPDLKYITPNYCYINYLDGEYKENDLKIRYVQAVSKKGIDTENVKFKNIKPVNAVCIYHKGAYENLVESYSIVMKYIEENGYELTDFPRECYIDGMWNKTDVNDWLTEIQVPVKKVEL